MDTLTLSYADGDGKIYRVCLVSQDGKTIVPLTSEKLSELLYTAPYQAEECICGKVFDKRENFEAHVRQRHNSEQYGAWRVV